MYQTVRDIRHYFANELACKEFTIDKTGAKTIELLGASFIADEDRIFGEPNEEYIQKEIEWYRSESTNINDIYGKDRDAPAAWKYAADKHGNINSNYGHLIFSEKYFNQFNRVLHELKCNPDSRRAMMVYNRPSIWTEYNEGGKSDFICTNAVTYYIRDNQLHAVVQMRSNDAWAGYRNDYAWARYVQDMLVTLLDRTYSNLSIGSLYWQVQNLHVYSKNFYLVDYYTKTGKTHISKAAYTELYPDSPYI